MNLAEYDSIRQVAGTKSGPVGYIDVGSGRPALFGRWRTDLPVSAALRRMTSGCFDRGTALARPARRLS